jgi:hypothetical protein
MRLRLLLSAAVAALLLTACQPSASPTASPESSDESAASSRPFPSGPLPSMVGDEDLEETLPTEAAGITFQAFSMSGPDFMEGEPDPQFFAFLEGLGADLEDVSVAVAFGANSDATQTATVLAFKVAGANATDLTDEFKATAAKGRDPLVWHSERVGDKAVEVADPNEDFPTPLAMYATGEVIYFVSSTSEQAIEEIIRQLP